METSFLEMSSEIASLRCERDKLANDISNSNQELRSSQDLAEAFELDKVRPFS